MTFSNPYSSLPRTKTRVVMVDVSEADYYCVKNVRPEQGTMSGVAGTLWKKLCDALRERNIGDYTQRTEFEQFICDLTVVEDGELQQLRIDSAKWQLYLARAGENGGRLHDEPVGGTVQHSVAPHGPGGEKAKGGAPPSNEAVVPNLSERDRAGRKGAGKEKGKGGP